METDEKDKINTENEFTEHINITTNNLTDGVKSRRPKRKRVHIPVYMYVLPAIALFIIIYAFIAEARRNRTEEAPQTDDNVIVTGVQADVSGLDWIDQNFLPLNRFSRPGTELEEVKGIVIHNIGNPATTALQNRNYFANVAPVEEIFVSAHFIVCMDGTVIQCIPVDEIAYASNTRNADTLSIEICHPDSTGKFTDESYNTAVRLAAWLSVQYGLTSDDIIRHFDVERESAPKLCPLYFVENEDAWERFKADVQNLIDRG